MLSPVFKNLIDYGVEMTPAHDPRKDAADGTLEQYK
jgi:hypothetical protein